MFTTYPAIFHRGDTAIWVEFPDLPGCFSQGDSLEEASRHAAEALGLHIEDFAEETGKDLPAPSDPASIAVPSDAVVRLVTADIEPDAVAI